MNWGHLSFVAALVAMMVPLLSVIGGEEYPELSPGETLTIALRPLTSLGTAGQPIETKFKT